jgi:hypothetical protein
MIIHGFSLPLLMSKN